MAVRDRRRRDFPATDPHAHHAVQITVAIRGSFVVEGSENSVRGAVAAAVRPDAEHVFSSDGFVAHLFVDPDGRLGRSVARALCLDAAEHGGVVAVEDTPALASFRDVVARAIERPIERDDVDPTAAADAADGADDDLAALVGHARKLVAALAGGGTDAVDRYDVRVRRMLDASLTLAEASAAAGLSEERMRHLFVEETGLAFRTHQLWKKLERAVAAFGSGASLTEAAHDAGFSDSAHLSRTFRRMFGITPDSLRLG